MDFWRIVYPTHRVLKNNAVSPPIEGCACSSKEAWSMAPHWLTSDFLKRGANVLGTLVCDAGNDHRRTKTHKARQWNGAFPPKSFYQLNSGVFVSSPCFTFLQMACKLDLPKLIAYGDELCGLYAFDEKNERGMLLRDTLLITKRQLEAYIASAKGQYGYRQAKKALPYIVERSASPMETVDEMLLCLPYRYGGYSIRNPKMNYEVELTQEASRLCHKEKCRTDISWPPIKLDLEYQGHADHLSSEDYKADRRRINALRIMGFEVIELTYDQVYDWRSFEILALHTAKTVGHRLQNRDMGLIKERDNLRRSLFEWNASFGHL